MNAREISIAEAKARLSELVNRVAYGGERIIITKRGNPVAVLSGVAGKGLNEAKGWIGNDDPFFKELETMEKKRHQRSLRVAERRTRYTSK